MPAAAAEKEQPATRFAKDQLKAFVERIERLEEEKKATSDDIRDVYAEAKGTGFDTKALRTIVRLRKLDMDERSDAVDCSLNEVVARKTTAGPLKWLATMPSCGPVENVITTASDGLYRSPCSGRKSTAPSCVAVM